MFFGGGRRQRPPPLEKGRRCSSRTEPGWFCLPSDVWECPCQAPLQGYSSLPSHGVIKEFTLLPTLSIEGRFSAGTQATLRAKTSERLCSALTSCVLLGQGLSLEGRCSPRSPNPISWPVTFTQAKSRVSGRCSTSILARAAPGKSGLHARGEGERVLALESREGTRASRRVEEGLSRSFSAAVS